MLILLICRQPEAVIYPDTKSLLMQENRVTHGVAVITGKTLKLLGQLQSGYMKGAVLLELASHQQPVDMIRFSDWHRYWA